MVFRVFQTDYLDPGPWIPLTHSCVYNKHKLSIELAFQSLLLVIHSITRPILSSSYSLLSTSLSPIFTMLSSYLSASFSLLFPPLLSPLLLSFPLPFPPLSYSLPVSSLLLCPLSPVCAMRRPLFKLCSLLCPPFMSYPVLS